MNDSLDRRLARLRDHTRPTGEPPAIDRLAAARRPSTPGGSPAWRPVAAAAAVLAIVLVAGLLVARRDDQPGRRVDAAGPTATTTPEGGLFGARTGTTLVVAPGYGPLYALDLDTGLGQAYLATDGVPGDYDHRLTALDDGVAYPGGDTARFLPWTLDEPSRSLGDAWIYVPSGNQGRIWLVTNDQSDPYADTVTEVDGDGRVSVPSTDLPDAVYPYAAVGDSLVVGYGDRMLRLGLFTPGEPGIEPIAGQNVVAAAGDQLAVSLPCDACNRLRLSSVGTRDTVDVHLPGSPFAAAFSPDGGTLAVWVSSPDQAFGYLALVDTRTGQLTEIPGSESGAFGNLVWSEDGRWVVAIVGAADGTHLVGYRLGDSQAEAVASSLLQTGAPVAVASADGPDLHADDPVNCPEAPGRDSNTNPLPNLTTDRPCRVIAPVAPDGVVTAQDWVVDRGEVARAELVAHEQLTGPGSQPLLQTYEGPVQDWAAVNGLDLRPVAVTLTTAGGVRSRQWTLEGEEDSPGRPTLSINVDYLDTPLDLGENVGLSYDVQDLDDGTVQVSVEGSGLQVLRVFPDGFLINATLGDGVVDVDLDDLEGLVAELPWPPP